MKFAKELEARTRPEWAASLPPYKLIKKLLSSGGDNVTNAFAALLQPSVDAANAYVADARCRHAAALVRIQTLREALVGAHSTNTNDARAVLDARRALAADEHALWEIGRDAHDFAELAYTAFYKSAKKHDKTTGKSLLVPLLAVLEAQPFLQPLTEGGDVTSGGSAGDSIMTASGGSSEAEGDASPVIFRGGGGSALNGSPRPVLVDAVTYIEALPRDATHPMRLHVFRSYAPLGKAQVNEEFEEMGDGGGGEEEEGGVFENQQDIEREDMGRRGEEEGEEEEEGILSSTIMPNTNLDSEAAERLSERVVDSGEEVSSTLSPPTLTRSRISMTLLTPLETINESKMVTTTSSPSINLNIEAVLTAPPHFTHSSSFESIKSLGTSSSRLVRTPNRSELAAILHSPPTVTVTAATDSSPQSNFNAPAAIDDEAKILPTSTASSLANLDALTLTATTTSAAAAATTAAATAAAAAAEAAESLACFDAAMASLSTLASSALTAAAPELATDRDGGHRLQMLRAAVRAAHTRVRSLPPNSLERLAAATAEKHMAFGLAARALSAQFALAQPEHAAALEYLVAAHHALFSAELPDVPPPPSDHAALLAGLSLPRLRVTASSSSRLQRVRTKLATGLGSSSSSHRLVRSSSSSHSQGGGMGGDVDTGQSTGLIFVPWPDEMNLPAAAAASVTAAAPGSTFPTSVSQQRLRSTSNTTPGASSDNDASNVSQEDTPVRVGGGGSSRVLITLSGGDPSLPPPLLALHVVLHKHVQIDVHLHHWVQHGVHLSQRHLMMQTEDKEIRHELCRHQYLRSHHLRPLALQLLLLLIA